MDYDSDEVFRRGFLMICRIILLFFICLSWWFNIGEISFLFIFLIVSKNFEMFVWLWVSFIGVLWWRCIIDFM